MISIIIRTRNEENWIGQCLNRIKSQTATDWEVVLVDNGSRDKTVEKAMATLPGIRLVTVSDYRPGHALNEGIRHSRGDFLVCLSAHCLPVNEFWLESLLRNMEDPLIVGVYGRQLPMSFTSPEDKRDLLNTFGLDRRVQRKDSFFHNANSMIRRTAWERHPFDEQASNIEDRLWAREVLNAGFAVAYEPDAAVYHHHGIHQGGRQERCRGVVRILESLFPEEALGGEKTELDTLNVVAIVSVQTNSASDAVFDEELLAATFNAIRESRHVDEIIFAVDDPAISRLGEPWGAEVVMRPEELSRFGARTDDVLRFVLDELAEQGRYPDVVAPLEITYPFRPPGLIDALLEKMIQEGLDSVIAGFREFRPCWAESDNGLLRIDNPQRPRAERTPLIVGLPTLGCVTRPSCLRDGSRLGKKLGVVEISQKLCTMEVRSEADLELYKAIQDVGAAHVSKEDFVKSDSIYAGCNVAKGDC